MSNGAVSSVAMVAFFVYLLGCGLHLAWPGCRSRWQDWAVMATMVPGVVVFVAGWVYLACVGGLAV